MSSIKPVVWRTVAGLYTLSGLPHARHRGRVVILTYHRIVPERIVQEECVQPGMYVLERSFDAHLAYLRKQFEVVAFDELLERWRNGRLDRERSFCVITFDDGWRDNYEHAFPLLAKHGVPATIFLATDFIGTDRWFWPDQLVWLLNKAGWNTMPKAEQQAVSAVLTEWIGIGYTPQSGRFFRVGSNTAIDHDGIVELCKNLDMESIQRLIERLCHALHVTLPQKRVLLNWDEVRTMAAGGVTFGSHSCSHRIMTKLPLDEAKTELVESRQALLRQGIKPASVFCYPNGNLNVHIQALVRESGYLAAVGCAIGLEGGRPQDPFALKRISLHEDASSSESLLAFALSGLR